MKNKTYVVTGATSGIGLALVRKIAGESIVYAGYRSESKKSLLEEISKNIYPFYIDYEKPETIKPAVDYIKSKCGKLDTLVNIAGCVVAGPIENISIDEIRRQFNVNVFGHIEITQGLAEILNDGKIINVSSMASYGVFPFISPYCASKKALDMFFNSYLIENKRNIKVISIKPGVISTPLWCKSVEANSKYISECADYQKEMEYLIKNAQKNEETGLSADAVVNTILEADRAKNPKLSYTIGNDAFIAHLVSLLPQNIINFLVKFGLKVRMR